MSTKRLLAFIAGFSVATSSLAAPAPYKIDPEHFSIAFLVEHIGYERLIGMFSAGSGEFVYDEQTKKLTSGTVEVQAASVDSHHEGRDNHVRSADFLGAEKFPVVRFVARDYKPGKGNTGVLRGDLSLLGQTHPVEVSVTLNKAAKYPFGHSKHTLGISARAKIKRSQWGMSYGVGNRMVGDEVELLFEFEALKQ